MLNLETQAHIVTCSSPNTGRSAPLRNNSVFTPTLCAMLCRPIISSGTGPAPLHYRSLCGVSCGRP